MVERQTHVLLDYVVGAPPSAEYSADVLRGLSNQELLTRLHQAVQALLSVNAKGQITLVHDDGTAMRLNNLSAIWNAAALRGYTREDLFDSIMRLGVHQESWRRLFEQMGSPKAWAPPGTPLPRDFEALVARIYEMRNEGWAVTHDDRLRDAVTGSSRQVDVVLRRKDGNGEVVVVIECKQHKTRIDVQEVESFLAKLRDIGGHCGIMVSSAGFTTDATAKARHYGLETYMLTDAHKLDWHQQLRRTSWRIPFPLDPTFTPVEGFAPGQVPPPKAIPMSDLLIRINGRERGAIMMLAEVGLDLAAKGVRLPVSVRLELPPGTTLGVRGFDWCMPLAVAESVVAYVHVEKVAPVDVPDRSQTFVYSHTARGDEIVAHIDLEDVRRSSRR